MSCEQADILLYYLENIEGVESAKVYERTADAVVRYAADKDGFVRQNIIKEVQKFVYDKVEVPDGLIENSGRELNRESDLSYLPGKCCPQSLLRILPRNHFQPVRNTVYTSHYNDIILYY